MTKKSKKLKEASWLTDPCQYDVVHSELRGPRQCQFVSGKPDTIDLTTPEAKAKVSSIPTTNQVAFTTNRTNDDFIHLQSGRVRARKRKRTTDSITSQDLQLSARKPVKTFVPDDAWAIIFGRSHPKFLLQARLVCRDWYLILSHNSIWRQALEHSYGSTLPKCPPALSEFQYANLLAGRGCQVKPCHRRETRKTYWPFLLRACEDCLQKVIRQMPDHESREASAYRELRLGLGDRALQHIPPELNDLLPAGIMLNGKWNDARSLDLDGRVWQHNQMKHCVIKEEYNALRAEFREKAMRWPESFQTWARTKWVLTRTRMKNAQAIKDAVTEMPNPRKELRIQKIAYYRDQASLLNPPIEFDVLQRMAAYQQVVENPNQPSKRSWEMLRVKIDVPELRNQARKLVDWDKQRILDLIVGTNTCGEAGAQFYEHRLPIINVEDEADFPKEVAFIVSIARTELLKLLDSISDQDLLLTWLNNVRARYEQSPEKPSGLSTIGKVDKYTLLLDDARTVILRVLTPRLQSVTADRKKRILTSLRCIGCTRTDSSKLFTLDSLMHHIRKTHAKRVGEGMHFWKFSKIPRVGRDQFQTSIAWYDIEWPMSMPAVLARQKVTADINWDPDVPPTPSSHRPSEAHLDPIPWFNLTASDFSDNFRHALRHLIDTRLEPIAKFTLALKYAKRLGDKAVNSGFDSITNHLNTLRDSDYCPNDFSSADDILNESSFKGLGGLELACGICVHGRETTTMDIYPLHPLVAHWVRWHSYSSNQRVGGLVDLMTDAQLLKTIQEVDEKLQGQIKRERVRNRRALTEHRQIGVDPRSATLFEIPLASERVADLFNGLGESSLNNLD